MPRSVEPADSFLLRNNSEAHLSPLSEAIAPGTEILSHDAERQRAVAKMPKALSSFLRKARLADA